MKEKNILEIANDYYKKGRRLVAPLVGFPGVEIVESNIKLAQQNFGEHFRAIKKIAYEFKPDIVFPLMDLSIEANALGRYTIFPKEDSATVPKSHFDTGEIEKLKDINISFDSRVMGYVETMKLMSVGLPEDIIRGAYITGPYSVVALIIGADEAAMATALDPKRLHYLCSFVTEKIREYATLLISAGAELICVLEPTAVMLGPSQFKHFSAFYVNRIIESIKFSGVDTVYHTCGNTMHLIDQMVDSGIDALSLDSEDMGVHMHDVLKKVPQNIVVMGNINPSTTMLRQTPENVSKEVKDLLDKTKDYPNYILSTGCDLPQETPVENIKAFIKTGRQYKIKN
ncbi:MAG: uroporphyrinogen decarboxylase family protein [Actinobacteria bacterium]|nr:uroporphyrinogen decarboxylase family protein [Actinomycetota bacterium]